MYTFKQVFYSSPRLYLLYYSITLLYNIPMYIISFLKYRLTHLSFFCLAFIVFVLFDDFLSGNICIVLRNCPERVHPFNIVACAWLAPTTRTRSRFAVGWTRMTFSRNFDEINRLRPRSWHGPRLGCLCLRLREASRRSLAMAIGRTSRSLQTNEMVARAHVSLTRRLMRKICHGDDRSVVRNMCSVNWIGLIRW